MNSSSSSKFDAIRWICDRQPSLERYVEFGSVPLLHFTLMWNMFEGSLCDASASPAKLKAVANTLAQTILLEKSADREFLDFTKERYWTDGAPSHRFSFLRLRSAAEVDVVINVISGNSANDADVIYGLLLIVYRYRNNTFHGLKEVANVFGSPELFEQSSRFLSIVLDCAGAA